MRILGIDPGFARMGYAVLDSDHDDIELIDFGCIKTGIATLFSRRLLKIADEIEDLIKKYEPNIASLETLYFSKNISTGIKVAQARGAILLMLADYGLQIREFSPQAVKIAATGNGAAKKADVQKMLQIIFQLDKKPSPDDAADALAIALCCANTKY